MSFGSRECSTWNKSAEGDFIALLRTQGAFPEVSLPTGQNGSPAALYPLTQATTVLAFKFDQGVLVAGDRRATAGNVVVYKHADKVLDIDRHSLMAIAGVPATAWEMARVLEHSFHYFRRTQLQELSHEGKVRALSRLLRDNLGMVLQGVGVVVPIFATFDLKAQIPRIYFYDPLGAQFEVAEFAASGSGSPAVKAVLQYENLYGVSPLAKRTEQEALLLALRSLEIAADTDSATGGIDARANVFPIIKIITSQGIRTLDPAQIAALAGRETPSGAANSSSGV
jgi:proteasome beta subunit